jgi:hypothetical protein
MVLALAAFGLLLEPVAHAQLSVPIHGNIPFDFHVGDTVVPAGSYQVSSQIGVPTVLFIRGSGQRPTIIMRLSFDLQSSSPNQKPTLVFHRYGSTYFLSEVWQGLDREGGRGLLPSKAERVKAREMATSAMPNSVELASVIFTAR